MRRIESIRFSVLIVLVMATLGNAQARPKHHAKRDEVPVEGPGSAKQSVEMKKMTDTFAGMWRTTATVEKGPMFPQAGTAKGRSDFRSGPAGNSVVERARSHGAMGLFAGMGLMWFDQQAAAYKAIWCDSMSPGGCMEFGKGQWDGGNLVFTTSMNMGQNTMQITGTYSAIAADSFTYTLEVGMDSAPPAKVMTVQYEREQSKAVVTPPANVPPATNAQPAPETKPQ